jgi:hypothetical protein
MRSALFWDIMRRRVVIVYRRFGTNRGGSLKSLQNDIRHVQRVVTIKYNNYSNSKHVKLI